MCSLSLPIGKGMDRLHNFGGLVKNEYIKIYKKTSTRVLLVIFVAVVICYPGIMKLINHISMEEMNSYSNDISWKENIIQEDLYTLKNGEDKSGLAQYKIEALEAADINEQWQFDAVMNIKTLNKADDKQEIQKLTMLMKTNDWRGYCKYRVDEPKTESDTWEMQYRLDHDIPFSGEEYAEENKIIENVVNAMSGYTDYQSTLSSTDQVIIGKYMLDNGIYENTSAKNSRLTSIDPYEKLTFWDVFIRTPFLVTGIGYIMLALAGSCVANEFSQGTIKFLLINPVKRGKIFAAKYFTVITMGLLLMLITLIISIPVTGIFFGFDGFTAPYLEVVKEDVVVKSSMIHMVKTYLIASVGMVIMSTMAFMISCLAKSSVLAIIVGFIMSSVGATISMIMSSFHIDWGRYLIFANTDVLGIHNGTTSFPNQTMGVALVVIAVHMAVFLLTGWDAFTRRSV